MDVSKLLNPRLIELMEADEQGRVVILPTRAEEQRAVVERALELHLWDWQVAYIWGDSSYLMPGRGTGKTFAQIIWLCVVEQPPIVLDASRATDVHGISVSLDGSVDYPNYHWFRAEVYRIYSKLKLFQVPGLRKIYFSLAEARSAEPGPWSYYKY